MKLQRLSPLIRRSLHTSLPRYEADSIQRSNDTIQEMLEVHEGLTNPKENMKAAASRYQSAGLASPASAEGGTPLRKFKRHQYIAPHQLTPSSMQAYASHRRPRPPLLGPSRSETSTTDPFKRLNLDPLIETLNPGLLNQFLTEMGKVKGRNRTGLSWINQRKLGKAVRRGRCIGLIPYFRGRGVAL